MTELQISLSKCKVEGNKLFLPNIKDGILANYKEVGSALLNAGASYKSNSFVFPNSAQPYIDRLMDGEKPNLKKEFQFFGTPVRLADILVEKAAIKQEHKILEPSAGQGAIVDAIIRQLPNKTVDYCELMDINRNILGVHPDTHYICDDFLNIEGQYSNYYDRIIANPPFSKNQDIDHIRKMYECLKPGGTLVSISSVSWQTGSQKKQVEFREWLYNLDADLEEIERGAFKESGTAVGGIIITIKK